MLVHTYGQSAHQDAFTKLKLDFQAANLSATQKYQAVPIKEAS